MIDLDVANMITAALLAAALLYCIFSKRVKDGLIMKAGLMIMVLSCAGDTAAYFTEAWEASYTSTQVRDLLLHVGGLLVFAGRFSQAFIGRAKKRRATDRFVEPLKEK